MKFVRQTALLLFFLGVSLTIIRADDELSTELIDGSLDEIINKYFPSAMFSFDDIVDPKNGSANASDDQVLKPLNNDTIHGLHGLLQLIGQVLKSMGDQADYRADDFNDESVLSVENNVVLTKEDKNYLYNNLTEDSEDNSMAHEPKFIYIRSQSKISSMHIREFHECVSCNADDGARKAYKQCLQDLSVKNQELLKACCNTSFDNDFCKNASSGNIDYKSICQDPKKALNVGDCFWLKVENKDKDDIKKYRECKMQIINRYCTENGLDVKNWQA